MATTESSSAQGKLSVGTKLAYGAGDLGAAIVASINGFYLNAFLLDVAGLRPAAAGTIFLIVKFWDAVNDPLVGTLTDRINTRWGRRRPWLLFGAVPFGLAFLLHWLVPDLSQAGKFWYYLVVAILLDMAYTVVNVPYTALTPELTQDYDERTSLNAYRFSFSILGSMVAAFLHGIIVAMFDDARIGNGAAAAIWSVMIVASSLITFAFVRETYHGQSQRESSDDLGILKGLGIAFSNRPFIYVTAIYLLSWLCIQFVQNNLLLYARYWMDVEEQFPFIVATVQISAFIFLLVWARISQRIGKQNVYYAGMSVWIVVSIILYFIQPGQLTVLFVLAGLAGIGVAVAYLVPWSMLPDVIELDELETGQRREGIYYGFFVFLQKVGLGLGLILSNFVLELTGYITPESNGLFPDQPPAVLSALRFFVSLAPAVVLLISFPVVRRYPVTRELHAEVKAELARRRSTGG